VLRRRPCIAIEHGDTRRRRAGFAVAKLRVQTQSRICKRTHPSSHEVTLRQAWITRMASPVKRLKRRMVKNRELASCLASSRFTSFYFLTLLTFTDPIMEALAASAVLAVAAALL
jgi:hypothetical protein